MSEMENMLAVIHGERPERFPYTPMGHWNRRACLKLLPADCYDDHIYCLPIDKWGPEERSESSRLASVNYARYMDVSSLGVGKGGALPFGHGGPAEIIGKLESRESDGREIYRFEGGSRRLVRYDPYSVQYGLTFPINSHEDLDALQMPDPRDPSRWVDVEGDVAAFEEAGVMPAAKIMGFFSGIHNNFYDFEPLLLDFFDSPEFVQRLTDKLAAWSLACVEEALQRGVKLIEVCDDLGTPEGMLISPEQFERFFLPHYRALFETCHSRGAYVHMHSHGNIVPILPLLIDAGVDILNPFDPHEVPALDELVERFGQSVVLCGFIPSNYYLLERVRDIESLFARASSLGKRCKRGYVMMEHGFPEDLSPERFRLILDLVEKYRRLD
ncbi:uroporphyrinogen decarboxylase family protein [Gemmatimonadota bacterium]